MSTVCSFTGVGDLAISNPPSKLREGDKNEANYESGRPEYFLYSLQRIPKRPYGKTSNPHDEIRHSIR
jgi:hypothetical protein